MSEANSLDFEGFLPFDGLGGFLSYPLTFKIVQVVSFQTVTSKKEASHGVSPQIWPVQLLTESVVWTLWN